MTQPRKQPPLDRSEGDVNLSPARIEWRHANLDEATRELLDADARCFLQQSLSTPCLNGLAGCEGIFLEDLQGRRIMDFHGNSVHQVGFAHPKVVEAVKRQLDDLSFCTRRYTNRPAVELAEKLIEITPGGLDKVLFAPGGTSAIGMALKLARLATGRHKTVSMWDSFHGASLDAISIGGEALFRRGAGPLLPGCEHVPPPGEYRCLWDCATRGGCDLKCAEYIEYVLEKEGDVAAVIAEPIRATGHVPAKEYWQRVRAACDRHGALLIFDEICQGLGRTGRMFACEHFGVTPDILVLGKGLGGGIFPMAAIVARSELDVAWESAIGHYTHEKSPLGSAAALATINVIMEEELVPHALELGAGALPRLREFQQGCPLVGDVRGVGLLLAVELVADQKSKEPAVDKAEQVMYDCLTRGVSFKLTMGNIITLTPPLIISAKQLDEALEIVMQSMKEQQP